MSDRIPAKASWCSHCRVPEHYKRGSPCPEHKAKDGTACDYGGPYVYDPSTWVLSVVGNHYRAYRIFPDGSDRLVTYICDGYDPRHGFWMRDETDGYQTNVSERAMNATYHRVWPKLER